VLFKISSGSTSAVVHQILSKSDNIFTEIWRFNDFQNGGRPPSWILKICSFCHMAFVDMPFCFLVQNFAEIRKSVDELWKKAIFLNFLKFQFLVTWLQHLLYVPNFIKTGRFFTDIWRFNDFQNGGRRSSWILNICRFCHLALVDIPFC